ncbi:transcriptional regulator, HxlR family [Campylobacter pinnipediorum subsp. caledonicus]|uniref:Transcriptional regulator, HxlR family n=1 Tax=Campylobacter pinnipediorum subsp. caledonicus TaxID=1874362 RepID=A0A1S6U6R2_9BACT|nr:helix-turn-helix domain-containing protein [Campylobacter pinnipediorum]AQW87365.1 transcriptional regulator, HxlR family [Campylobacter pinnipediorum subsp. caledonicus]OPA72554.1 transcriptional regulator [Campylobacter pinnipediorum subsp. caledonicus]
MYIVNEKEYKCPVSITLDVFNDRWKLAIIWHLIDGKKRFKELHNNIGEITQKTLTVKLKELEEKNIITRTVYAQVPPKVEYSLTPIGQRLQPTLDEMYKWGLAYVKDNGTILDDINTSSKIPKR